MKLKYFYLNADSKEHINEYLAGLGMAKVGNSNELVRFNEDHSAKELPQGYSNQELLVGAANNDVHNKFLTHARLIGDERGIDTNLKKWNPDVIIAPADSAYNLLVSAAGYPSATMPLSYLDFNGRPIGLAAFTMANHDDTLLKILSA